MSYLSYFTPGNISNRTVPQLVSCKDVDKDTSNRYTTKPWTQVQPVLTPLY